MNSGGAYAYGLWPVVLANILFFLIFAFAFAFPRKRLEWRSMGAFTAFLAALFTEMYGFPLTIYVLTSLFGKGYPTANPFRHQQGHLWATLTGWKYANLICNLGSLVAVGGMVLVWSGWKRIHRSKGELAISGIYSYIRHPQYLGFILITGGMLIQWPTFITLLMWPVLILAYGRLAGREERELEERFGSEYAEYRSGVPPFFPRLRLTWRTEESRFKA
jgi:protein-S-isoprenylcysteine O-methyltransferase Ste14